MKRKYMKRNLAERIAHLTRKLQMKESYHQRHLDGLSFLREKIQHLQNRLDQKSEESNKEVAP